MVSEIQKTFPASEVDIRKIFRHDDRVERARIFDPSQPFEKQRSKHEVTMSLYDGFVLQEIFSEIIPSSEADHVHIIFTDLLTCTFSEDDWRYHGRTVICGTPSIISTTGIIEAPAKPKEFYLARYGGASDLASAEKKFAGRFIAYGDKRISSAAAIYALQALYFFVADGEPFCQDRNCGLYNAHWQDELIHLIEVSTLCINHKRMAEIFNAANRS